ncbi:MAG: hypothetical protein KDI55_00125 [Anaerolineae bacterium]|nr:hypothetical protein [Anaerolineae bacterium]
MKLISITIIVLSMSPLVDVEDQQENGRPVIIDPWKEFIRCVPETMNHNKVSRDAAVEICTAIWFPDVSGVSKKR